MSEEPVGPLDELDSRSGFRVSGSIFRPLRGPIACTLYRCPKPMRFRSGKPGWEVAPGVFFYINDNGMREYVQLVE